MKTRLPTLKELPTGEPLLFMKWLDQNGIKVFTSQDSKLIGDIMFQPSDYERWKNELSIVD